MSRGNLARPGIRKALFRLTAVLGAFALGCAYKPLTQTSGPVQSAASLDSAVVKSAGALPSSLTPAISLSLHARYLHFGKPMGPSMEKWWAKQQTKLRARVQDMQCQTPWLVSARWDDAEAIDRLVLETTFDTRGSKARYWITEFSKYLVPSSDEGVVSVRARVYRKGALVREYEAEGTYRTRRHLIFLFLPMMWHSTVPGKVAENTIQDALLAVEHDAQTLFSTP